MEIIDKFYKGVFGSSLVQRKPGLMVLFVFGGGLLIVYAITYFFSDIDDRTRSNLLGFTFIGFLLGYYILKPLVISKRLPIIGTISWVVSLALLIASVALRNNTGFTGFLKFAYLGSGALMYLYLRHYLFHQNTDK